jgi:RNA polymerase sigma-70 factor (ECF subfamily)
VEELGLDDSLCIKELQQLIFQEVERLPEKAKIIFNYSRIDHLDSREIAEKLNISHRTVENQISKSLKHLRIFINNLKSLLFF